MGVQQIFVSLHPWSQLGSTTYDSMTAMDMCVQYANGTMRPWAGWTLPTCTDGYGLPHTAAARTFDNDASIRNCLYDPSNPKARNFLWSKLKRGYYDIGITNFWTDGTEPAGAPSGGLPEDIVFYSDPETGEKRDLPSPGAELNCINAHTAVRHCKLSISVASVCMCESHLNY